LRKVEIIDFCQHVHARQERHGIPNAFRFSHYRNGKEMASAKYGTPVGEELAAARASKQRERRKSKGKKGAVQRNTTTVLGIDEQPIGLGAVGAGTPSPDINNYIPIDPVLLESVHEPENLHNINKSTRGKTRSKGKARAPRDDSHNHPAVSGPVAAALEPSIIVTQGEMTMLATQGYNTTIIPMNGPNDGPPLYQVPATATAMLQGAAGQENIEGEGSHTGPQVPTVRQGPKRRLRKADKETIEQGKKLGKRSMGTRANPGKRRG
jgi:hypothetical protein